MLNNLPIDLHVNSVCDVVDTFSKSKRIKKCSSCGDAGHYAKTCPTIMSSRVVSEVSSSQISLSGIVFDDEGGLIEGKHVSFPDVEFDDKDEALKSIKDWNFSIGKSVATCPQEVKDNRYVTVTGGSCLNIRCSTSVVGGKYVQV